MNKTLTMEQVATIRTSLFSIRAAIRMRHASYSKTRG